MNPTLAIIRGGLAALSAIAPRAAGRLAFELFCHPVRRAAVRPYEVEALSAATVEHVSVDGKQIVLYRWGSGERPVLFMHGWESRGSRFAPLVQPLLDAGCTPISFDAPGHGDSRSRGSTIPFYAAIAAKVEQEYGPLQAIVGHSFGVPAALYAARAGVNARRIVGISGPCTFDFLIAEVGRRLKLRPSVQADMRRRVEALLPGVDLSRELSANYAPERVSAPVLLLHDTDDATVPLSEAQSTAAAYGDQCELVVTSGLRHSGALRDPASVERVVAFVMSA